VQPGRDFEVQPLSLEPGDRVVFLTDGMLERNAASLDLAATLTGTADLHPREVVHALGAAVLRTTGGHLRDDATSRRWSASTGTAGHSVIAGRNRGPIPATPPRASDRCRGFWWVERVVRIDVVDEPWLLQSPCPPQ
jgi:hypothetical protein